MSEPAYSASGPIRFLVAAALCLALGVVVWRELAPVTPRFLARAQGALTDAAWGDGYWYWLENGGKPDARLVRTRAGQREVVSEGQNVSAFSVNGKTVAWVGGGGAAWTIYATGADSASRTSVWSGSVEPRGICVSGGKVYWLEAAAPLMADAVPLPPLSARVRLKAAPLAGGAAVTMSEIMELDAGKVLGESGGQVYATVSRDGLQRVTALYRAPANGGPAHRVAAMLGEQTAILSQTGTVYWTGPSREAADPERVVCMRRLANDGKVQVLQDWLPARGVLCQGAGRVYYLATNSTGKSVWPVTEVAGLPSGTDLPGHYDALAVGGGEALSRDSTSGGETPLYRVPLR